MKKNFLKFSIFFILSFLLIALDQFTKYLSKTYLKNNKPIEFFGDAIELTYFENNGAAFGILKNQFFLFFIITIVVILFLMLYLYKLQFTKKYMLHFIILILFFSGAIGNFIDRVKVHYVIDFIYFKIIDFAVFNLADSYITIACLLLVYMLLFVKNFDIDIKNDFSD